MRENTARCFFYTAGGCAILRDPLPRLAGGGVGGLTAGCETVRENTGRFYGYARIRIHFKVGTPSGELWDIMNCWKRAHTAGQVTGLPRATRFNLEARPEKGPPHQRLWQISECVGGPSQDAHWY